ncbi:uncharacterized protein [Ptychodera flava]|uniref:uncharacterized protein n=1 Tax=Ptychodera flava TaxID=63121 RepID=UPI00396A4986
MVTGIRVEIPLVFLLNIVSDITCERAVNHTHSDVDGHMDLPCSYEVIVREDTPVGEVIFTFNRKQSDVIGSAMSESSIYRNSSSNVHQVFESIRLTDGNKNERFRVESETGDISVLGYLDHEIDSEYVLGILLHTSQNKSQSTCTVKIILEDVEGWPPFYNETCAMPTRKQEKGVNIPFSFSIGEPKWKVDMTTQNIQPSEFKVDSNNGKCMFTLYRAVKARYVIENRIFKTSDVKVQFESHYGLEVNFSVYFKKTDFPPHAMYDEQWFNRTQVDGIPARRSALLKVDVKNIDTRMSTVPVFVTGYVGTQKFISYGVWIEHIGCPEGKYGFLCDKPCMCKNDAECSVFNGACKCKAGWYGPACDIPKPVIKIFPKHQDVEYGTTSFLICQARNIALPKTFQEWYNMTAWSLNDEYIFYHSKVLKLGFSNHIRFFGTSHLQINIGITDEWTGRYQCKVTDKYNHVYVASATISTVCPKNLFGQYCNVSCDCLDGSSTSCDRYLGCVCNPGWTGRYCHIDLIPPVILRCPQDITQYIESGKAYTNVTWLVPSVEENSDDVILFSNHNPGSVFRKGTTLVQYTAVDFSNNTDHCRFKIHVITKSKLGLSLGISSACLLVFVIPVCVLLGFRYRHKLVKFFQDDDDYDWDETKKYDAMVSYSSEDGDFVETIEARLEKEKERKLLLHERDFPLGEDIFKNINEAFENSRASILILSKAFLESGYCMHEAEMAMDSWITKRQKLIPIFKENIEGKDISPVIHDIMSSITYLEWHRVETEQDEDEFWNRLANALTKPKRKSSLLSSVRKATARLIGRHGGVNYTRLHNQAV